MRLNLPLILAASIACQGLAADPLPTPANTARIGIWWKWDLNRDWSSDGRRARGAIRMFADAEKTEPLVVERLRFSLEIDCPGRDKPERLSARGQDVAQLEAEVSCPMAASKDFEVRWEFEAIDRRTGPVSDNGTW